MKRKFFLFIVIALLSSCSYDDNALWDKVDDLDSRIEAIESKLNNINSNIASLRSIVEKMSNNKAITEVVQTENGYSLNFSDGSSISLSNGQNGENGTNAPVIGVKQDVDNIYYWTLTANGTTEWLLDDNGGKIRVSGNNGNDGVSPTLGIDAQGYWTIDLGEGAVRMLDVSGSPIKAVGIDGGDGDSFLKSIVENPDCVVITLANGSQITIPKGVAFDMIISGIEDNVFAAGEVKTYTFELNNVDDCTLLDISDGWKASVSGDKLSIEAPAKFTDDKKYGVLKFHISSSSGLCRVKKVEVSMYELRVLTFEDADYVGTGNYLGNNDWSSLIDNPQYGGSLLYGDYKSCDYNWYDENNTFLASEFPENWNNKVYWGGGHAISNYVDMDLSHGDFNHQLSVYYQDAKTSKGGHIGSDNFCVHYGYRDNSGYSAKNLPFIYFADGQARIVDHMYVMNTTYAMNCYIDGNSLTAAIGEDDWVKLVAIGYDADGEESHTVEMFLVNGPTKIVSEWTKWDLTGLGKVSKIEFNILGSSDNGYGFSQPAYFAYDDVAVRF